MSFLTVTLNPAFSPSASAEAQAYAVAAVTGVSPQPRRRDSNRQAAQSAAPRRDATVMVPSHAGRGTIRDILV